MTNFCQVQSNVSQSGESTPPVTSKAAHPPSAKDMEEALNKLPAGRPSASFLANADPYNNNSSNNSQTPSSSEASPTNSAILNSHFTTGDSSTESTPTPTAELPHGEDKYSRKHRPNLSNKLSDIAPRFMFSKQKPGKSSKSSKPKSALGDLKHKGSHTSLFHDSDDSSGKRSSHSVLELKRFFKPSKRKSRTTTSSKHSSELHHGNSSASLKNMPFGEDGFKKYGKLGRVLGSGAGGSVRLMKRTSDGTTFAIKEFRARNATESQREYAKKVTAEFCIGSTLHHPNVVETLDLIQDDAGKYYEVMEYCPFDFFAIVMSGKMSREEIACCFMQILNGVTYLHKLGLAHRDLKLDNCVVTSDGILKIIDFGSASVFKYPFESEIVLAHGVVGSDPYLAPEVLTSMKYDPQPADIWSIAVIFCCMTLRRFAWKVPRLSDQSFNLFATKPTKEEEESYLHPPPPQPRTEDGKPPQKPVIKGPWRLLRLLPQDSRHIIGRMLDLDPKKRATLDEIWADPWIKSLKMCTIKDGKVILQDNHTHTFVEDEQAHLESYKKK